MVTKEQYIEFLLHTPINYTGSYFAAHIENVSHDSVSDFLNKQQTTAASLWPIVQPLLADTTKSFLIIDDSVQEKPYAYAMPLVYRHWSGNKHRVVSGINIVNLVHSSGDGEYYPIDYCIYAPSHDGKTKNDHFLTMLARAFDERAINATYVLFDTWYASNENLKYLVQKGKVFYTTIKANRLVSLGKGLGYIHLDAIDWTEERLRTGVSVKFKGLSFRVTLFKVVAKNGSVDWVITNDDDAKLTVSTVRGRNAIRWDVECLHRELKQLTGIEQCQSQHDNAQRTHILCCYHAWVALKVYAKRLRMTLYRAKMAIYDRFLTDMLRSPIIRALQPQYV